MPDVAVKESKRAFDPTQGRDELNFAEFPLFYLGQRVPKDLTELTFESEITDAVRNRTIRRKLTIDAGKSENIPTSRDMDVLHSLIALAKHANDLQSDTVHFSRYQLCEILGWPDNGQSYKRIEEALCKWLEITIYFEAWWDKDDDQWRNLKGFHIIDEVELNELSSGGRPGRIRQTELPFSSVRFGKRVFESLKAGNVKRLNLTDVFHLKLPTSKRLYGFLDKRFYHRKRLDFDLRTLACEHVGMSRDYKTNKLKTKLFPAIEELVSLGFIEPMTFEERFTRTGHGIYQVHFARKQRQEIGSLPLPGSKSERSENRQLINELTNHGMTASTARQLVEDTSISNDDIRLQIEVLEWKIDDADEDAPRRPGGYLRKAITEGYDPPRGFTPKAEREAIKQRAEDVRRKYEREAELRTQIENQKRADEDNAKAEQKGRVNAYLNALGHDERSRVIDDAIATIPVGHFSRKYVGAYRKNPSRDSIAKVMIDGVIEKHVLGILDSKPVAAE